ncbi:hypothetical protein B0I37DRAFT_440917 [Chaetomium sp. MPI-CAGE-AT-0009]|nr:hypothetical protein B0I37DRAFT_440917 [Chaetomium sp. MPI-CAGE-AT-0009]
MRHRIKKNRNPTNTSLEPEEPKQTNPPLPSFPHFTRLPTETRAQIWTVAILDDLSVGRYAPPLPTKRSKPSAAAMPRIKRGEGGGGYGRLPPQQPAPKGPAPPLLHIIPFHTLPTEAPFTSTNAYLEARYGADWDKGADMEAPRRREALVAEAVEAVREHARTRTVLLPPGRAPHTLARFSAGWCRRSEVVRSCAEAQAAAHALGRWANRDGLGGFGGGGDAVGQEALVALGKGEVCCFVNVRADGSPIDWQEGLPFWNGECGGYGWKPSDSHTPCGQGSPDDHLGLFPGGEEWVGAVREGWGSGSERLAGVSGLRGLLPALEQCEVLAVVWHPDMCRHFRVGPPPILGEAETWACGPLRQTRRYVPSSSGTWRVCPSVIPD